MNVLLKGFDMPRPSGFIDVALETLAWSAIVGGPPYILLALWATWWIRGRPEPAIRRVMFLAPLLMVAAFAGACLIMGVTGDRMEIWIRIWGRGTSIIVPLGYGYVTLTLLLRRWLGARALEATS